MDSHDSRPDTDPDTTVEESPETDHPETQSTSTEGGRSLSRRSAVAAALGIGGLTLGLTDPASGHQPTAARNPGRRKAGRYLTFERGTYAFTGPAEWANAGNFTNTASGPNSVVAGGDGNEASDAHTTVGGGQDNTAGVTGRSASGATISGGVANTANNKRATVGGGTDNVASGSNATVGGGDGNEATDPYATVAGGRDNEAAYNGATVGGGQTNKATRSHATVGGGSDNEAGGPNATVGGGEANETSSPFATVGGGRHNAADSYGATVGGGTTNEATGTRATVPGGRGNIADGDYSVALGREADTNGHDGAIVFGDSSTATIAAQAPDEVRSQMPIYAPAFNSTSARSAKTAIEPVDPEAVLAGVNSLAVSTWEFSHQDDGRHIGPMAEDFHDAFDLGDDAETIATVDADGVALAAIQGLSQQLADRTDQLEELSRENEQLRERVTAIEERLSEVDAAETGPTSMTD